MEIMHRIPRTGRYSRLARASFAFLLVVVAAAPLAAAGTLDRIKESGKLNLGYGESRPFSYKDDSGKPAGFGVALCGKVADALKAQLGLSSLSINYLPMADKNEGLQAVADGKIDMLCDATVPTLAARKRVSFSIPVFAGGVGAVVRADASTRLKDVLSGRIPPTSANWRGNADVLLRESTLAAVPGSRAEKRSRGARKRIEIGPQNHSRSTTSRPACRGCLTAAQTPFSANERILLDFVNRSGSRDLQVLDRYYTQETLAFAVARDDTDFRLGVDAALSQLFHSGGVSEVYAQSFGPISASAATFYDLVAVEE